MTVCLSHVIEGDLSIPAVNSVIGVQNLVSMKFNLSPEKI